MRNITYSNKPALDINLLRKYPDISIYITKERTVSCNIDGHLVTRKYKNGSRMIKYGKDEPWYIVGNYTRIPPDYTELRGHILYGDAFSENKKVIYSKLVSFAIANPGKIIRVRKHSKPGYLYFFNLINNIEGL